MNLDQIQAEQAATNAVVAALRDLIPLCPDVSLQARYTGVLASLARRTRVLEGQLIAGAPTATDAASLAATWFALDADHAVVYKRARPGCRIGQRARVHAGPAGQTYLRVSNINVPYEEVRAALGYVKPKLPAGPSLLDDYTPPAPTAALVNCAALDDPNGSII